MKNPYKRTKLNGKPIDEHRKVMTLHVGRKLGRLELVHHKNDDKRDNRLENLEIVTPKKHAAIHLQKHPLTKFCEACGKEFTPHPTKRARAKTCSRECRYELLSRANRKPDRPRSMYRDGACPSEVKARHRSRKPSSKRTPKRGPI